jgi:hypothetical protein
MNEPTSEHEPADRASAPTGAAGLLAAFGFGAGEEASTWVDSYESICRALGHAVVAGKLFETTVRVAAPALAADGTDDHAARADLDEGLRQSVHRAIGRLGAVDPDLQQRLRSGRLRRNAVVHDGLIRVLVAIATETAPALVEELDAAAEELMESANALMAAVWPHVAHIADIGDIDRDVATAGLMTQVFADSSLLDGVARLQDFDTVMQELLRRLDDAS